MNRDHDMIPVVGFAGMFYCARCGASPGTYSYLQPCPIAETPAKDDFGTSLAAGMSDPIGDAVRESSFDRIDRIFKNK
jgi:hypothetical protein